MRASTSQVTRGITNAGLPKVSLCDGKLRLNCNMQRADEGAFQKACEELLKSPVREVEIDLTACTYINSLAIGTLVDTVTQLKADGKQVTVRVSREVGRFLHMAHLYHLFSYEIVEPA